MKWEIGQKIVGPNGVVGVYEGTAKNDPWQRADTGRKQQGATATLLANLVREKPRRAPVKISPWYPIGEAEDV